MNLKNEVPSRELCEKLKTIGWPQDSYWYYYLWPIKDEDEAKALGVKVGDVLHTFGTWNANEENPVAAPTIAQMLEVLPTLYMLYQYEGTREWCVNKIPVARDNYDQYPNMLDKSAPNALAKMLIHLHSQGLITFKEGK